MLIKQEFINQKMSLKDLQASSPLPAANLVLVFGSVKRFNDAKLAGILKSRYPSAQIVGCTTAGEINPHGVFDDSLQITAIAWEKTTQRVVHERAAAMENSFQTGANLAKSLAADSLKVVLVLSDGLHLNGSELLTGFQSVLGTNTPIIGGMAGDNATFTGTLQLINDTISDNLVIAVGLYGDQLFATSGALGGWKPYGPPRKITRSDKNVVYELDGKPALPLYRMYIGEHYAKNLPSSGLKFPFAIIEEGARGVEKVRTLLGIDADNNSLTFAGNVAKGETVRFCQATHERLIDGATGAATMVKTNLPDSTFNHTALAICVSCVGRKGVMAERVAEEITAVQAIFGSQTVITGFYSNGEFAPLPNTSDSVLHNQTMTIGYLSESSPIV
jgi:hypothetical protein